MDFLAKIDGVNHFEPLGAEAFKKSLKLKLNDYIRLETWKERNIIFHRKFFAFLNTVIYFLPEDNKYDRFRNIDYLREELMIMIGEVDIHITFEGEQVLKPKSISFRSMDNERFEKVYSLSVDAVLKYFLHDISKEDFEKHLLNFL
jgi:hypothetical protein